jgi:Dyp-type peroxidase family
MDRLAFDDIQGIIVRGYKELPFARFLLLRVIDAAQARAWLGALAVTRASEPSGDVATNVAFSWSGLSALRPELAPELFAPEFREGMSDDEHRNRVLGDVGEQSPANWQWGGPGDSVHAILLLYGATKAKLDELDARVSKSTGVGVTRRLETRTLADSDEGAGKYWFREHFGFRDGVAQPRLALHARTPDEMRRGIARDADADNSVRAGEFLFGYDNEYGKKPDGGGPPELARHGSFLVFRQLEQDVCGFWRFVREKARELSIDPILLASKMVGRWPNGAPLVRAPAKETAGLEQFDSFGYAQTDRRGLACPLASHIRRSNPRDALFDDATESVRVVNKHRLVRRGRPYGEPLSKPLDPAHFLPKLDAIAASPPVSRGLHFLCFNANIRRQFEFVQQTWIQNPKFPHQYDGPDPILSSGGGEFELPGEPARRRVSPLESFVRMRGGAYFFMPGIAAVRRLSEP